MTGVVALAAGQYYSLALKSDGTVWAWGFNTYGELGDGTTTNRFSPVQVSGLTDVVAVAAGLSHGLALKSDGTVWAWGPNSNGQLGDGTTTNRSSPVRVSGLTGVVAVAGGQYHSLALKYDGTVVAWGLNTFSQLPASPAAVQYTTTPIDYTATPVDDLFPSGGVVPSGWLSATGSSAPWTIAADVPYAGPQALKSGTVGNAAHSGIQVSGNFRDGFVAFQRKVSSEVNADYLRLYVDGVVKGSWSGQQDWTHVGTFVSSGTHTVAWAYEKNGSGSSGTDAAWIDSVDLPSAFADVPASDFAFDYVNALKDAGITTGCSSGNYCPSQNVTREQMAAFIIRAEEGEPASACTSPPFTDVPISDVFCKYVKRMQDLAITTGCGSGNYCPNQSVTRDQMAAFIIRAVQGNPAAGYCGSTAPFSDVPVSNTFCGHIKRMSELGITTGCGGGNYCPSQTVTREQMAAFLARAFLGM